MKKILLGLLVISKNIFCPGEGFENGEQAEGQSSKSAQATPKIHWQHPTLIGASKFNFNGKSIKSLSDDELEEQNYNNKMQAIRQRNLKQLSKNWERSLNRDDVLGREQLDQKRMSTDKKSVTFASDVQDRESFDPKNVDTWDFNRLKRITIKDIRSLSVDQIGKLLQHSDYLKDFSSKYLRAIAPTIFLRLPEEQMKDLLKNDEAILSKFSEEQIIAMKFNTHLQELNVPALRLLFDNLDFLDALSKKQIDKINPEVLSQALYHKLPKLLDQDFVEKLSNEQIMKLYEDHIAWGFHNLGTSFKQNFTSEALEYIHEKINQLEKKRISQQAEIEALEKKIAQLEKERKSSSL